MVADIAWHRLGGAELDGLFQAESAPLDLGDRYELSDRLGAGGQGAVYAGRDCLLGRSVAIKCAHGRRGSLRAEASLLASLAHPAIPQMYDVGVTADGRDWLVMELGEGQRLDYWLNQEQPNLLRRLQVFLTLGEGVSHAHARGVVHRDIKPSNIVVGPHDRALILDWGLSAAGIQRAICGSPHFAAPEQLDGQAADQRADVYSLGVLLYWLLSGRLPYAREVADFQEFRRVRGGLQVLPLSRTAPRVGRELAELVMRALAAQPGARPSLVHLCAAVARERDRLSHYQGPRRRLLAGIVVLLLTALSAFILGWLCAS